MDGATELRLTHVGSTPADRCHDVCSTAWASSIGGSLRRLVTTGEGAPGPNPDEERLAEGAHAGRG